MPLSPDAPVGPNRVVGYAEGEIRLPDRLIRRSALITATGVRDWPVRSLAELGPDEMKPVLELGVDVVLLATAVRCQFPPPALIACAAAAGIGLEVMDLGAACRTFNVLIAEDRAVALAALLPG